MTLTAGHAAAADLIRGGQETFKINFGGILNQSDSSVRVDGPNGRGVEVDLEGIAGLQRDVSSTLLSGTWRFSPNHRIGLQSFSVRRTAQKAIDQTLVIDDKTYPIGTNLSTEVKTQFLIGNYQYSFIRDDRVELAGMAGLYTARFRFRFNSTNPPTEVETKATAPLPVVGLSLDTFVTPRWTISAFAEGLYLKVDNVTGRVGYIGLSTDYMLARNFGVGLGFTSVATGADVEDSSGFRGAFEWRSKSAFAYVQLRF